MDCFITLHILLLFLIYDLNRYKTGVLTTQQLVKMIKNRTQN
jgi:hypothetical protein